MRKEELMSMTKEEILNKLGSEQLEYLRKKIYRCIKKDLLFDDAEFYLLSKLDNIKANIAGRYIYDKENEVHKIYISDKQIEDYKKYYFAKDYFSKLLKNAVIDTIRHEILHGYVEERFRYSCKVKNQECDASIIFLMYLQFFNVRSGHSCAYAYKHSKMHQVVKKCKDYKEFLDLVIEVIDKVNKVQKILKDKYTEQGKSVSIIFGDKNSSMFKFISNKSKYIVKNEEQQLKQMNIEAIDFMLGSTTDIDSIEALVDKKLNNREIAKIREIKKVYMKKINEDIWNKEIILEDIIF